MASTTVSLKRGPFLSRKFLILFVATLLTATMLMGATAAHAASATLTWSAPGTNSDGSALTDLAGYNVYVGTAPGKYAPAIDVGNATGYTVNNLPDGATYYFAVTAYNTSKMESSASNEVSKVCAALPATYVITATAGSGGSITAVNNSTVSTASTSGTTVTSVSVTAGASQSFTITPASGYTLAAVTVNGASAGSVTSYAFANVTANQTISATFTPATSGGTTGTTGGTGATSGGTTGGSTTGTTAATFAVNSGGTQYTDASGVSYSTDTSYTSGAVSTVTAAISGTKDQALYQSERYGNFSYNVPLANGAYTVTMKFAETYWTAAGQRVFSVAANGQTVISNLDIFAKVGKNAAYDVTVPVKVTNGALALTFTTQVDNAKVCGIVVKPATPPVFAANAGGSGYSSATGVSYAADSLYTSGATSSTTAAISGTSDQALYQSERYGNFTYNVPVANGSYSVTLKFAETYWSAAGQRVFSVAANGQTVISNLDIFAKVGKNAAYDVTVPVTVTNGTLTLAFTGQVDNAKVSAIVVQPASSSGALEFTSNAGGANYASANGVAYLADNGSLSGSTASTTAAISGTTDQALYQSERYGNFSYNTPLANGSYSVTLKFAETYWTAAGKRVFNVDINGARALSNVDIFAKVGSNAAYDVEIPVTVTNGTLGINFTSVVDNAKVSAIAVKKL